MPAKHASKCSSSFFDPSRFLSWICIHNSLCLICSLTETFVLLPLFIQVSSQNTTQHQILSNCLALFFLYSVTIGGYFLYAWSIVFFWQMGFQKMSKIMFLEWCMYWLECQCFAVYPGPQAWSELWELAPHMPPDPSPVSTWTDLCSYMLASTNQVPSFLLQNLLILL